MFDGDQEDGALFFEAENGQAFGISERSVREIFGKRGINLVFLNACQSGSGGHNFDKGIAQSLVVHGLPAAVANQIQCARYFGHFVRTALLLGACARHEHWPGNLRSADRRALGKPTVELGTRKGGGALVDRGLDPLPGGVEGHPRLAVPHLS